MNPFSTFLHRNPTGYFASVLSSIFYELLRIFFVLNPEQKCSRRIKGYLTNSMALVFR